MDRKILAMILAGIVSVLLITGCSSPVEDQNVSNAGTSQEQEIKAEEEISILPSDARIAIAYTREEGDFTSSFIAKAQGNLVSAGVLEENIESTGASAEELTDIAAGMIGNGCSVLMVGNADENNAPGITDAAVKADIPVVYFGTSPGEKEIARWEEKGWKAVYVGSLSDQSAEKRADLISGTDLEKIDLNNDGEIGMAVLYTGNDSAGDAVNRDTVSLLQEREVPVYDLTQDSEEDAYEGTDRDSAAEQVSDWMSEYGADLDLILCADDMQALGAWDAVSEGKKKVGHDVMIMGFDARIDSLAQVAAGNIRSTSFNDFMEQARNASDLVLAFLKGTWTGEARIMINHVFVTVDNAQEILDIAEKTRESIPEPEVGGDETEDPENETEE